MIVTHHWEGEPNASPSIKKVNGVEVSRNLIVSPRTPRISSDYLIYQASFGSVSPQHGETLHISLKGDLGDGKTDWAIYNSGGNVSVGSLSLSNEDLSSDGVYRKTGDWRIGSQGNGDLRVYVQPIVAISISSLEWIMLELGEPSPTYWDGDTPDYSTNTLKVYDGSSWKAFKPKAYI